MAILLHVFDAPWQLELARLCGWHDGFARV